MKNRVPRDTRHTVASSRPLTIDVSWPHPVSPGGVIMRAACPTATLNRERLVAMVVVDSQVDPFDLDALAVSDRFRLFGFTRRDDYLAYLWVLRAIDRLRGAHVAQAHTDDVAEVLAEFAAAHDTVPGNLTSLRGRLDNLTDDGVLHRLEDASRAGSLARYRNRQSVYQFSELGHRADAAVEGVLAARVQDANLSRLVFSDILRDMRGLAEANRAGDGEEIVRRLISLDRVMEEMAGRSARFHLTLGDITRSTDASPETFLQYKHALLAHMSDFMAELDRYLPRLALAVAQVESTGDWHPPKPGGRGRRTAPDGVRRRARRLAAPVGSRPGLVFRGWGGIARRRVGRRYTCRSIQRDRAAPPDHRGSARWGQPCHPAPAPGGVDIQHR